MSEGSASTSPLVEPVAWVIAPDMHVGAVERVREVWHYRRILWFFSVKAVERLWSKTRMGPFAIVLRSVVPIFAGSLVYGTIMKVPSGGVPYFLFLLAGTTIWSCFDGPLTWATRGIESNRQLLTKLYLPRLILPLANISAGLVDVAVLAVVLVATIAYYRYTDGVWYASMSSRLFVAAASVFLALMLAFAMSLWTAVWQARARDTRFVLLYTLSFWYLLTPVIYPASHLPASARWLAAANPMTGPVEAFKWAVLGIGALPVVPLAISFAISSVVLALGFRYFTATEVQTIDRL